MTLHMMRLEPNLRRAAFFGHERALASTGADDGYIWHALLTAAFGDRAPKPWRLFENDGRNPRTPKGSVQLLGYCNTDATGLLDVFHKQCADERAGRIARAAEAALNLRCLATKPMPAHFAAGQQLRFETRLRPTVRSNLNLDAAGKLIGRTGRGRKIEIDAAYHAALVALEQDQTAPQPNPDEVYKDWLSSRLAEGGARIDPRHTALLWRRRARVVRRDKARDICVHGARGGGPDICIGGLLTVENPDAFTQLLARGVGRHLAFGFGMLLLEPARQC